MPASVSDLTQTLDLFGLRRWRGAEFALFCCSCTFFCVPLWLRSLCLLGEGYQAGDGRSAELRCDNL